MCCFEDFPGTEAKKKLSNFDHGILISFSKHKSRAASGQPCGVLIFIYQISYFLIFPNSGPVARNKKRRKEIRVCHSMRSNVKLPVQHPPTARACLSLFQRPMTQLITRAEGCRVEVSTPSFILFLVVSGADAHASRRARNRDKR